MTEETFYYVEIQGGLPSIFELTVKNLGDETFLPLSIKSVVAMPNNLRTNFDGIRIIDCCETLNEAVDKSIQYIELMNIQMLANKIYINYFSVTLSGILMKGSEELLQEYYDIIKRNSV